jgi:hypothetical protein
MTQPILMPFQDLPFNGDTFICDKFLELKKQYSITTAIETGSCFYSTTEWLAANFEQVYTVEINNDFARHGLHKVIDKANVSYAIGDSLNFLPIIKHKIIEDKCIFFADSHWLEYCPLLDELEIISNMALINPPIIAIHDFKTPNAELGYDSWNGKDYDFDLIQDSVKKLEYVYDCTYQLEYNNEAVGAKRGIVYLCPEIKTPQKRTTKK